MENKPKATHFIITKHYGDQEPTWEADLRMLFDSGLFRCAAGQLEKGKKSGKIHLQAYLGAKTQIHGTKITSLLPTAAFKPPKKWQNDKANIGARMYEYCTKDDTRISEGSLVLGDPPKRVDNKQNGARGRQLQTERYATAIDLAKKGQFDDIDPELYLKHHTTLKRIHVESKRTELLPFPYPLRHWQHYITRAISKPDDRKVTWVYDSDGGSGKSTFAKWLASSPETFYIDGGKKEEILFLIKEDIKTLLIDIPRSGKDFVPYGLMETFKNGIWTTNKYEGNRVIRKEAGAVVVLANFWPDITKLSKDRWDIIEVSQDKSYFKNINYYDVPESL